VETLPLAKHQYYLTMSFLSPYADDTLRDNPAVLICLLPRFRIWLFSFTFIFFRKEK
jgi:hypothetical protein